MLLNFPGVIVFLLSLICLQQKIRSVQGDDELPIPTCTRHEADVIQCIRDRLEEVRPKLKEGVPALHIPKLEPLYIKELIAAEGNAIKITTRDLYVHGPSDFVLGDLSINDDKHEFKFDLTFPNLKLNGKYDVNGRIIMLQIKGNGNLTGEFQNVRANVTLHGAKIQKDGKDFFHFDDVKIKLKVSKGKLHLTNLFNGDKQLGDMINNAINTNFEAFAKELIPIIEKALDKFVLVAVDGIVESFPFDVLYPE